MEEAVIKERHGADVLLAVLGIGGKAVQSFPCGIEGGKAELGLALGQQFDIVDRTTGDLGGRLHVGNLFRQDLGDAAPIGVENTARAAGDDGDARLGARQPGIGHRAGDQSCRDGEDGAAGQARPGFIGQFLLTMVFCSTLASPYKAVT